jgi:serine/threonine protein kinase
MNFEIIDELGQGRYGKVCSVVHKETGRKYALKTFFDSIPIVDILREIYPYHYLKKTYHEGYQSLNICPIHNIFYYCPDKSWNLLYELMDYSLHHLISASDLSMSRFTYQQILSIAYQLIKGVYQLEQVGVVHRDIKPENILVKGPDVKLHDFGMAKVKQFSYNYLFTGNNAIHPTSTYSQPTLDTPQVCTIWYRSPEILLGLNVDSKSDIWSVGCILYELMHESPLFMGSTEIEMLQQILQRLSIIDGPTRDLFQRYSTMNFVTEQPNIRQTWSKEPFLNLLLSRMLVVHPEQRASPKELLDLFEGSEYMNLIRPVRPLIGPVKTHLKNFSLNIPDRTIKYNFFPVSTSSVTLKDKLHTSIPKYYDIVLRLLQTTIQVYFRHIIGSPEVRLLKFTEYIQVYFHSIEVFLRYMSTETIDETKDYYYYLYSIFYLMSYFYQRHSISSYPYMMVSYHKNIILNLKMSVGFNNFYYAACRKLDSFLVAIDQSRKRTCYIMFWIFLIRKSIIDPYYTETDLTDTWDIISNPESNNRLKNYLRADKTNQNRTFYLLFSTMLGENIFDHLSLFV